MTTWWSALVVGIPAAIAVVMSGLRWLRVAQREHYLSGASTRFAARWWKTGANSILAVLALGAAVAAFLVDGWGSVAAFWVMCVIVTIGPLGLSIRGRTSRLAWTPRLIRMATFTALVLAVLVVSALITKRAWLVALTVAVVPLVVDLAALALAPIEKWLGRRWVDEAVSVLKAVRPRIVAVTGSYGKTTTKLAIAHLVGGVMPTVASPASFNNRLGLARAINEGLAPGTQVFVAEMGTYGPGEIADMCRWIPPDVSVITAIGPVHLERMRTEEGIVAAKREILADDAVAVINIDHPLLATLADEEHGRRRVVRCSASRVEADVLAVSSGTVIVDGVTVGRFDPATIHPGNVACAVGAVVGLGIDPISVAGRLASIPTAPHRQVESRSDRGFDIIDDTFNANPAGARRALDRLAGRTEAALRVVVTPGMVELGARQIDENRLFADEASKVASHLLVVGQTNRQALIDGAAAGGEADVIVTATREEAVEWVRSNLGPGDVVLYENDLPDHFP